MLLAKIWNGNLHKTRKIYTIVHSYTREFPCVFLHKNVCTRRRRFSYLHFCYYIILKSLCWTYTLYTTTWHLSVYVSSLFFATLSPFPFLDTSPHTHIQCYHIYFICFFSFSICFSNTYIAKRMELSKAFYLLYIVFIPVRFVVIPNQWISVVPNDLVFSVNCMRGMRLCMLEKEKKTISKVLFEKPVFGFVWVRVYVCVVVLAIVSAFLTAVCDFNVIFGAYSMENRTEVSNWTVSNREHRMCTCTDHDWCNRAPLYMQTLHTHIHTSTVCVCTCACLLFGM